MRELGEIGQIMDRWPAGKARVKVMMRTGCELYFGHYPHSVFFLNHRLSGSDFVFFCRWQNKIWDPCTLLLLVSNRRTSCASQRLKDQNLIMLYYVTRRRTYHQFSKHSRLIPIVKPTISTSFSNLFYFILVYHSTCFGQSFHPSSGVQDCT